MTAKYDLILFTETRSLRGNSYLRISIHDPINIAQYLIGKYNIHLFMATPSYKAKRQ